MRVPDIVEVDPFDAPAFDAWHAAYLAADAAGREPLAVHPWFLEEARAEEQVRGRATWSALYVARADDEVVCAGRLELPLLDNLAMASLAVYTVPGHARRGHGSRMLAHLERVAAHRGRSILLGEVPYPYVADGAARAGDTRDVGRGTPAVEFARAQGFSLALTDVQRLLHVPVPLATLDRLADEAAGRHAAYSLVSFVGRVPDELAEGWSELTSSLMTEAPMGDLDLEPETPSVATLRENEQIHVAQRRTRYATVALTATGEMAAYTDIMVPEADPTVAHQWGTLVRRADRGHRLGLATKVANLRLLQSSRSDVRAVCTYNAAVNTHMVGVNVDLGFRPVECLGEFQKRLPGGPPDPGRGPKS